MTRTNLAFHPDFRIRIVGFILRNENILIVDVPDKFLHLIFDTNHSILYTNHFHIIFENALFEYCLIVVRRMFCKTVENDIFYFTTLKRFAKSWWKYRWRYFPWNKFPLFCMLNQRLIGFNKYNPKNERLCSFYDFQSDKYLLLQLQVRIILYKLMQ